MQLKSHTSSGFSLIEIMVSVAIFSVVVMAGTLAILSIIDANQKSQSLNSVMTNLNTALETMARDVRVGSEYEILNNGTGIKFIPGSNCSACTGVTYQLIGGSIQKNDTRVEAEGVFHPITALEVHITDMNFSLLDSGPQPAVILKLKGYAQTRVKTRSDFFLQTLMSQRLIF